MANNNTITNTNVDINEGTRTTTKDNPDNFESEIVKSYLHNNTLHLNPFQINQFMLKTKKTLFDEEPSDEVIPSPTFDNLFNLFSENCFIISKSSSSKKWKPQCNNNYHFFVIRLSDDSRKCIGWDSSSKMKKTATAEKNSNDLLTKFSLLSFTSATDRGEKEKEEQEREQQQQQPAEKDVEQHLVKIAARFIVHQMKTTGIVTNHSTTSNEVTHDSEPSPPPSSSFSSSLFGISKKVFGRASTAFTSVLALYDLAEDPYHHHHPQHQFSDNIDTHYLNEDEDDYALGHNNKGHIDNGQIIHYDDDDDDAKDYFFSTNNNNDYQTTNNGNKVAIRTSLLPQQKVLETDAVWNVRLVIDCWSVVLHHIKQKIKSLTVKESDGDVVLDTYEQLITVSTSIGSDKRSSKRSSSSVQGILLNRWGDGEMSFLTFCHEAASATKESKSKTIAILSTEQQQQQQQQHSHPIENICNILSNMTTGTSLEIILRTLMETNNAILCRDGDIIALFPTFNHVVFKQDVEKPTVNDADVAIFKINSTLQSIEKRIESLTHQSETMKQRALSAKQSDNMKLALMHMKRRQILVNEIDRSSNSLLSVEGVLHSLKRARNDVQLLKAYEMMNNTMKSMREETSLSYVEEVMDDFNDGNEELQHIQDCFNVPPVDNYDIDDMERDLLALANNDDEDGSNGCHDEEEKQTNVASDHDGGGIEEIILEHHSKEQSQPAIAS